MRKYRGGEEMAITVDLIILAIILLCAIIGYVRGLTGSILKIISFVLALIIAFALFVPVSNLIIENTQLDDSLSQSIREMIVNENGTEEEKMPEAITDYIGQQIQNAADDTREAIADSTANDVAVTIIKAGTWIVLFIVARILLLLLNFITSLIARLPVIKQFDKLGGVIFGVLEGLLIVYIILAILSFVLPLIDEAFIVAINESYIGSMLYNNNLLLEIIF